MAEQPTVALSISSFAEADAAPLERLRANATVLDNPHGRKLSADEVVELLSQADATIAGTEPLNAQVLEQVPNLKAISRVGIGLDNVDLDAAKRLGIRVFNTPDAVTDAAAELTLAGMLSTLRHVPYMSRELHDGRWTRKMGSLLRGKTVGIVGLGRIGSRVAALLEPFEPRLLGFDPAPVTTEHVQAVSLDELLRESDVVTLHAAAGERLLGAEELALMKSDAVLVNVARGALVDEVALHAALADGKLGAAYLDVFEQEPYDGPLRELDNAVLTPHAGSFAREARALMEGEAVDNLLGFFQGMKAIVFGGSGFVGSHVADALTDAGHDVTVFDLAPGQWLRPEQSFSAGDVTDTGAVAAAIDGHDVVYNFAGIADIDECRERPLDTVRVNVTGNANVLDGCRRAGVKRYLFASTIYVASESGSFYRVSKQACELYIEEYKREHGIPYTILRYGTLYGRRAGDTNSVHRYLKQALFDRRIDAVATGEELREYIQVEDAARLSVEVLADEFEGQQVVLTGQHSMRFRDLMALIREVVGPDVKINLTPPGEGNDSAHYSITPYHFRPKLPRKLVGNHYTDLGQGLIDCLQELHDAQTAEAK